MRQSTITNKGHNITAGQDRTLTVLQLKSENKNQLMLSQINKHDQM